MKTQQFITKHSIQRVIERTKLNNEKSSVRFIQNALERGKGAEHFAGRERQYLADLSNRGRRAIVYNSYCHIVAADGYCITVFKTPGWFEKAQYDGKKVIRNPRKYNRQRDLYDYNDRFYQDDMLDDAS